MPSAGEHDAPLRLLTGADRPLVMAWRALAALAALAALSADHPPLWRLAMLVLVAASLASVEWRQRRSPERNIILFRDGRGEFDGQSALLQPAAWLSSRYAVIRLQVGRRQHRCLISATRQETGEYRKLLAWMRLQPWKIT